MADMPTKKELQLELNTIKSAGLSLVSSKTMARVIAPMIQRQSKIQYATSKRLSAVWMKQARERADQELQKLDVLYNKDMGVSLKDDLLKEPKYFMAVPVIRELRDANPYLCESFFRDFFTKLGYAMREAGRKRAHDGGIDGLFVKLTDDLRTVRVAIQVKRYAMDDKVGSPVINQFKGSLEKYFVDYGVFITTGLFTAPAIEDSYKGKTPVSLIDVRALIKLFGNNGITYESFKHYKKTWAKECLTGDLLSFTELVDQGIIDKNGDEISANQNN